MPGKPDAIHHRVWRLVVRLIDLTSHAVALRLQCRADVGTVLRAMRGLSWFILGGMMSLLIGCAASPNAPYPARWWTPAPTAGAPAWEILPQEARSGEVILSKRNDLGILSNFAPTPFVYHGVRHLDAIPP
jgi:hypothetical protein